MRSKYYLWILNLLICFSITNSFAQQPFSLANQTNGSNADILLIGNNNLSIHRSNPYNFDGANQSLYMVQVDVDGDASTTNSSRATLTIPAAYRSCYKIKYAALYWAATYTPNSRAGINQVKLRIPGAASYQTITGNVIHDANTNIGYGKPYAAVADVTNLLNSSNAEGVYTVADIKCTEGQQAPGYSAGWHLYVIYENPTLPAKNITSFNGFAIVDGSTNVDINVSGFQTIPVGPVNAKMAFATLEGDYGISGDFFRVNGTKMRPPIRNTANDNFFNSSITDQVGYLAGRTPNSFNTLGYDAGVFNVANAGNAVIPNNASSATIQLGTSGDVYYHYFNAFAVDVIQPKIILTKSIATPSGIPIPNGSALSLGQTVDYAITLQNVGNDNATNVTIRDILPVNITFNPANGLFLPTGITLQSYNAATRELILNVNPSLVNAGGGRYTFYIRVRVAENCYDLVDACENRIINQAFVSYQGAINTAQISNDPSYAAYDACAVNAPTPTNFIGNIDSCSFNQNVFMCGTTTQLNAPGGYTTYTWTGPAGATIIPVAGTNNQSVIVNMVGNYDVFCNAPDPCVDIPIRFTVSSAGAGLINPVITYLQNLTVPNTINYDIQTCPDNGTLLPYLYLCGNGDTVPIVTNIAGAISIRWDKLVESSCTAVTNPNCPNVAATCNWVNQATGANYTVTSAGQYRITISFPDGCDRTFYFNATLEFLDPQAIVRDIVCTTPGRISINNVPASGYEFSLSTPAGLATNVWQVSNIFNAINTPGNYTVFIRKVGFPNGCIFQVQNLGIRSRNFSVTPTYTEPRCSGDRGSIRLVVNDVFPNYYFSLYTGPTATGTAVDVSGPISASNDYTFNNLSPGQQYSWLVTTDDGCSATGTHTMANPQALTVSASITRPLTACSTGEITITPVGGNAPYTFIVNGISQGSNNIISATGSGTFNIQVVDNNNCQATTSQTITLIPTPGITAVPTHIQCATAPNTGAITFNTISSSGHTFMYSINNGTSYSSSNVFSNLPAGTYPTLVQYTFSGVTCNLPPVNVTIVGATAISGTASVTTPLRCGASGGATISVVMNQTGAGGLEFNIGNGWVSTQNFTNLGPGTYTIQVRDLRGCTVSLASVTIAPLNGPTDLILVGEVRPSSCLTTGSLNVGVDVAAGTGGQSPRRYRITSPAAYTTAYQASGNFTNLPAGTYTIEVIDNNDCTYAENFTLQSLNALTLTSQVVNNVRCFGDSNGNGVFTISGLPNNVLYNYTVINTGTNATIASSSGNPRTPTTGSTIINLPLTNLPAGTYQLNFISSQYDNCNYTQTLVIGGPAQALAAPFTFVTPTCTANGSISVNPTGGWGGYTYSISPNAGVNISGNVFSNLVPNVNYTITVTDANGCQRTVTRTFTAPPAIEANVTGDFCYDGINAASLTVNVTSGTTPYEYNINGGAFQNSNTFPNLIPGTYTIIVRDANACTLTLNNNVIAPQLTINAAVTKELTCSNPTAATITGTVNGGIAPITTTVSHNGGLPTPASFPYTATLPGTYVFTATDARCSATSNIITIVAPTNPSATHVATNVLCNGGNTGTVNITASGGAAPYQINFNNQGLSTTTNYINLTAGTYPYVVVDNKGCTFNGSVTITQPNALTATTTVVPFSCNATTNAFQPATITVNPSNGTPGYQYSFNGSGFSTTNTLVVNDNGANQTIPYAVRDANGCTVSGSVTLQRLNPPTITGITQSTITCAATTATIQVNVANGVAPLSYTIGAPLNQTNPSGNFNNVPPGTYTVQVTDANGCFATRSLTINPVTPITISGNKLSDVLCNGGNSGAAVFTVAGFAGTYNYSLNGASAILNQTSSTINLNSLLAGTYTIVVVDPNTNCTASASVIITQPLIALSATAVTTRVNCNNDVSQITVSPNGGTSPYTYAAVIAGSAAPAVAAYNGNNPLSVDTNNGANLNWDVYVRDANGCTFRVPITVIIDGLPTVSIPNLASNQCTVPTGFSFTATGTGVNPLSYSIDGANFQASPTFIVNAPGTYTVTIMDGNGCRATSPTTITIYAPLTATASFVKDLTCSAPTAGTINLNVTGGRPAFTYQLLLNGVPTGGLVAMVGSTATINVNAAGNYTVTVTDANGCTYTTTTFVTMTPAVPPTVNAVASDPTCNNGTNGTITLNASGGTAPYSYSINGNAAVATNIFGGLGAGNHTYTVTDARGCATIGNVTINNPAPIVVTVVKTGIVCNLNNLGSFDVTINSGATAPYTFNLLNSSFGVITSSGLTAATNFLFPNLNFGDYYIQVIDAKGCQFLSPRERIETQPLLTLTASVDSNNCATGVDVTVTTIGGADPYDYSIVGQTDLITDSPLNTYTFDDLFHNTTYYLQVRDVNNCVSILEFTTPPAPSTINISAVTTTNVTCNGSGNGTLTFTVQNYDPTVTNINYVLVNAITNLPVVPAVNGTLVGPAGGPVTTTISGLVPGNYNIRVTEATGTLCSANHNFQITQPTQALNAIVTGNINANCNSGAQVIVSATGGTPNYTYAFVVDNVAPVALDFTTNNLGVLDPATSLNWDIWVRDANGCTFKIDHVIARDADPTINPIPQQCFIGAPLSFTVNGTTFNGNLTYGMNTVNTAPGTFVASPNFVVNAPGTYYFFVKDDNACIASTSVIVHPQLLLQATLAQDLFCNVDASINLVGSQGLAPYVNYGVSTNAGGPFAPIGGTTFTANIANTYYFQVTDSQGCTAVSNPIVVTPRTTPTFTFTQTNVSCIGGTNGTITITAANGLEPYSYSINNGVSYQSSNYFSGLTAGPYQVIVRDRKNCVSAVASVIIDQPTTIVPSLILNSGLTCGAGNSTQAALLTASANGGTPPYFYSFDGVNYTSTATYSAVIPGPVTVSVRDNNGCISTTATVIVPPLVPPTDMTFNASPVTCTNTTSIVTVTGVLGGTAPYNYSILSPIAVGPQGNVFNNLAPNNYLFQVTDANGCTATKFFRVDPVINISASAQILSNVSCNGGNNGSIRVNVSNFTGTYDYTVNGGAVVVGQNAASFDLTNLTAISYSIVISDNITGCTTTVNIPVSEPNVLGLNVISNFNATCNKVGVVTVEGTGGTPTYTYAAVNSGNPAPALTDYTNNAIFNLAAGNWDIYVKDINGCIINTPLTVTVGLTSNPRVTLPGVAVDQCTSNGTSYTFTATATPGFGVGPYSYSIDGVNFQNTTGIFNVTSPGLYTVTIKDANDCTGSGTIQIYPPVGLTLDVTQDADCAPANSGQITVTPSGGSANYTYQLIAPSPIVTGPQGNVFSNLTPGTYTVQINDTFLNLVTGTNVVCSRTATIDVIAPQTVQFTTSKTDVSCNGGNDGSISVTTVTGDLPLTYQIIAGTNLTLTYPIAIVGTTFGNLPAGTYTVSASNARNCNAQVVITITEPNPLVATATFTPYACNATNALQAATITVTAVGGTAAYTYSINGVDFVTSNQFSITDNGLAQNFTLWVKDANGCIDAINAPLVIPAYVPIVATVSPIVTRITCNNPERITINVTSGTGPYTYTYLAPTPAIATVTPVAGNPNQFDISAPGHYDFTVTDIATGCSTIVGHDVLPYNTIQATLTNPTMVSCFGGSDGTMVLNVQNYATNYTFTVFNAVTNLAVSPLLTNVPGSTNTPSNIGGLATGTYYVVVTALDSPFCPYSTGIQTIDTAPQLFIDSVVESANVTCSNNQGQITVSASGGTGTLQYQLTNGAGVVIVPFASNNVFSNLAAGTYTVTVRDANNCPVSSMITLTRPNAITATVPNVNLSCFGDTNGQMTVINVVGGQNIAANYTYTLNYTSAPARPSSGPQSSNIFNGLSAGSYSVTIQDGYNACGVTYNFDVLQPTAVSASLSVRVNSQSCLTSSQDLLLTASGGTGPYTYDTNPTGTFASGSFNASVIIPNLAPGQHTYYVRDSRGCMSIASNQITIDTLEPLALTIVNSKATVNCYADTDGYVRVKATGGLGNYQYTLSGINNLGIAVNLANNHGLFSGLGQGNYQISVSSSNGNPGLACNPVTIPFIVTGPLSNFTVDVTPNNVSCFQGNNGSINLAVTGGTGTIQYILTPSNDGAQAIDIPNPANHTIGNLTAGSYLLTVKDQNGCIALNQSVVVIAQPTTAVTAVIDPNLIIGEQCEGDNNGRILVQNIQGGTTNATTWYSVAVHLQGTTPNFVTLPQGQTTFDTDTTLAPGFYNVVVRDANECIWTEIVEVKKGDLINPEITLVNDCLNNQPLYILKVYNNISANSQGHFPLGSIVQLVGFNPAITVTSANQEVSFASNLYPQLANGGNFSVTVTSPTNCVKTVTTPQPIVPLLPLEVTLSQSGLNTALAVATGGMGDYTYEFYADGQLMQSGPEDTFIYTQQYNLIKVVVTDSSGCNATNSKRLIYIPIQIPDVITPDGNGQNDDWGPDFVDPTVYPRLVTKVYDRYGRLLATLPVGARWNGKYDGKELPSGDYWYVIKVDNNDGQEFVGHFTLYR